MKFVPGGYLQDWAADSPKFQARDRSRIKAIVAIAPWGEQPPYRAWDPQGLGAIRIPALFIAGDHDDVADYENGIQPAFDLATHADRCLLVYENARHNTGANPAPPEASRDFAILQAFDEPAWPKDRITSINQHFITAFLDLYLKGDRSKASYLHVAPARSNDGKWSVPPQAARYRRLQHGQRCRGQLILERVSAPLGARPGDVLSNCRAVANGDFGHFSR